MEIEDWNQEIIMSSSTQPTSASAAAFVEGVCLIALVVTILIILK